MRSTLGSRPLEHSRIGKVFVEKPDVLEDLVDGLDYGVGHVSKVSDSQSMSLRSKDSAANNHKNLLRREQQKQRTLQTEAAMKQNIQKSLERANEKQDRLFPVLLSNLDKATSFLDIIEKDISLHDETQKNKVRRQFEDWNSAVHGTIQVTAEQM